MLSLLHTLATSISIAWSIREETDTEVVQPFQPDAPTVLSPYQRRYLPKTHQRCKMNPSNRSCQNNLFDNWPGTVCLVTGIGLQLEHLPLLPAVHKYYEQPMQRRMDFELFGLSHFLCWGWIRSRGTTIDGSAVKIDGSAVKNSFR